MEVYDISLEGQVFLSEHESNKVCQCPKILAGQQIPPKTEHLSIPLSVDLLYGCLGFNYTECIVNTEIQAD